MFICAFALGLYHAILYEPGCFEAVAVIIAPSPEGCAVEEEFPIPLPFLRCELIVLCTGSAGCSECYHSNGTLKKFISSSLSFL